jgi:hypothetical protein
MLTGLRATEDFRGRVAETPVERGSKPTIWDFVPVCVKAGSRVTGARRRIRPRDAVAPHVLCERIRDSNSYSPNGARFTR